MEDIYEKILLSIPPDIIEDLDTSDVEICYETKTNEQPKQETVKKPVIEVIEDKPEPHPEEVKPQLEVKPAEKKPEFKPDFNAPRVDMLIDFGAPQQPQNTQQKAKDAVDLLFGEDSKKSNDDNILLYEKDQEAFAQLLFKLSDTDLSSTLFDLSKKHPDCGFFLLQISQRCGLSVTKLLKSLPALPQTPRLHDYLESKKQFVQTFGQFEGNYSLGEFTKANRTNPPPPGSPPICLDAIRLLQNSMDLIIAAFRDKPSKPLLDECLSLYQVIAYIIAKLVQFNINKTFLEAKIIPLYNNQHYNLKKAIDSSNLNVNFPEASFNFQDQNIIKRLRPPASNITLQ